MEILLTQVNDISILSLSGEISTENDNIQIKDAVQKELNNGVKKIILDVLAVTDVDSSGATEIARANKKTYEYNAKLKLCSKRNAKIVAILMVVKLFPLSNIYESQEKAIASFG